MPRVVGLDAGTACIGVCGIDDRRLFLDHSLPTRRALAEPAALVALLGRAAVAVAEGRIVDGVGGLSGPLGCRAGGALDGEVADLAGAVPKQLLFGGGAAAIAGGDADAAAPERLGRPTTTQEQVAWDAFVEGAAKTAIALAEALPAPKEFVLSGPLARVEPGREGS